MGFLFTKRTLQHNCLVHKLVILFIDMSNSNSSTKTILTLGGVAAGALATYWWRKQQQELCAASFEYPAGIALITGASSGIGEAYARKLAAVGYDLMLVARREDRLETLGSELSDDYGVDVQYLAADLSTQVGINKVAKYIRDSGNVSFLVNNAGFGTLTTFEQTKPNLVDKMVKLHVLATAALCRAALPAMIDQQAGFIINVSSVMSYMAEPEHANYCATKAYITTLSESLDREVSPHGVAVQALCPGLTRTEFHQAENFESFDASVYPDVMWQTTDAVVDASLQHLHTKRGGVCIPGPLNQAITSVARYHSIAPFLTTLYQKMTGQVSLQTDSTD